MMSVHDLMVMIGQYGYIGLFLCLWLGIVGLPIPDEVVVMTGGLVSTLRVLHAIPAFFVTYLGVVSGLTLGYLLGRILGDGVIQRIRKKDKLDKYLDKSNGLFDRYGKYALCISYFIPVIRHVMPYLAGMNRMPYRGYALFSYMTGLVWTLLYFMLGRYFGYSIQVIGDRMHDLGLCLLGLILVGFCATYLFHRIKGEIQNGKHSYSDC